MALNAFKLQFVCLQTPTSGYSMFTHVNKGESILTSLLQCAIQSHTPSDYKKPRSN